MCKSYFETRNYSLLDVSPSGCKLKRSNLTFGREFMGFLACSHRILVFLPGEQLPQPCQLRLPYESKESYNGHLWARDWVINCDLLSAIFPKPKTMVLTKYLLWCLAFCVSVSHGHVGLTYPPARKYDLDFLDNVRTKPPCGMPKGKSGH